MPPQTIELDRTDTRSPQAPARGPKLFVERRAARRARASVPPVEVVAALPPRWVIPAAGVVVTVPAALLAGPVAAVAGTAGVAVAQTLLLSRTRRRADRLDALAHTDHLTGLHNSRALWRDLEAILGTRAAALIIADLDHFKAVNDDHGHSAGDAVLRSFGQLLPGLVGDEGRCYRYGGEEFVVLLPDCGEQRAMVVADRLRRRVADGLGGALPALTLSAGVAAAAPGCAGHRLLDRADDALRHAKVSGRNRVMRSSRVDDRQAAEDEAVLAARRAALAIATAALEARDPDTADHSDDVVVLCDAIAGRLGIRGAERDHLLLAASLHDVGKVAIPHHILAKPGPLDAGEWAVMRQHTVTGEQILRSVPELEAVASLVRSAHERYDGTGYPDGLSGDDIPLASRVILCADAFHAMRSDRPYRSGRGPEAAVEELEACSGTQFDPVVAATLIGVVREANEPVPPSAVSRMLRRSPRLMALVATAAIGGTAMASVPSLRDSVRDMVRRDKAAPVSAPQRTPGSPASCAELALQGASCGTVGAFVPLTVTAPGAPAPTKTLPGGARPRAVPAGSSGRENRDGVPSTTLPGAPGIALALAPEALPENLSLPGTEGTPAADMSRPRQTTTDLSSRAEATGPLEGAAGRSGNAPGKADTIPGQVGSAPGRSGEAPGRSGATPSQSGATPGNSGSAPGHVGEPPGKSGSAPGKSGDTPGQAGGSPGSSGHAPGQSGGPPDNSGGSSGNPGNAPGPASGGDPVPPGNSGNSGTAPGNSGTAPGNSGNSGNAPGNSGNSGNSGNADNPPGQSGGTPGNSGGTPGNSGRSGNGSKGTAAPSAEPAGP